MRQRIVHTVTAWAALLLFMALFRPQHLPVEGLIVPFLLLFAALYSLWNLSIALRVRYGQNTALPHKHLGAVLCVGVVLLIVLQSLGQLTLRDVITLIAVISLGYLYLARSQFSAPKH